MVAPDILRLSFLHLRQSNGKKFTFNAGQYVVVEIEGEYRQYSILNPPHQTRTLDILVQLIPGGKGSEFFKKMKVGDRVEAKGPAGIFTVNWQSGKDIVFLATGSGIAPAFSMISSLLRSGESISEQKRMYLFWGVKHRDQAFLLGDLLEYQKARALFSFFICVSRDKIDEGERTYFTGGHIQDNIEALVIGDLNVYDYYVSGGRDAVSSLVAFLRSRGVDSAGISAERF